MSEINDTITDITNSKFCKSKKLYLEISLLRISDIINSNY